MDWNQDKLKLSQQLCFPLYACARETIKLYTPYLDQIGLTYTQYITMMVLWERKTITAKELGKVLYLDSGTLTPLLKKLEAKGFITRRRSETDERNLVVRLTEDGRELQEHAMSIPDRLSGSVNLTQQERGELHRLLYKLLEKEEA